MAGYLTEPAIQGAIQYLSTTYPGICQAITLPEPSVEGRPIRALRIGTRPSANQAVLFLGGVHAREVVNPDLLLSFADDICVAFTSNSGLTYGAKVYDPVAIQLVVKGLDIFIVPLVNPDGRVYVQDPNGDPMWRKNRATNAGSSCMGVDLNRNFDFLWSTGIGSSTDPCSLIYKGPAPFSEPETRNVKWLLDTFPNIDCLIDIHSFSNDLLYPWGDAPDQSIDPTMNFRNPAYSGAIGGGTYREYIPQSDENTLIADGTRICDAIAPVRGTQYVLKQSIGLYPTTGTSEDYAFSRHFVDPSKTVVHGYCMETGSVADYFQPPYTEALAIIQEVSSGLVQFCLRCLCPVVEIAQGTPLVERLGVIRNFRDTAMASSSAGTRYVQLLDEHSEELMALLLTNPALQARVAGLTEQLGDRTVAQGRKGPAPVDTKLIASIRRAIAELRSKASPALRRGLDEVEDGLRFFKGKTLVEGLAAADRVRTSKKTS